MEEKSKKEDTKIVPDEESQKILDEIEAEKKEAAGEEPEAEKKPKEKEEPEKEDAGKSEEEEEKDDPKPPKKDEEDQDDEEDEDDEDESGKKPQKRTPTLMPIFQHKIAEKKWEAEKEALTLELAKLKTNTKDESEPEKNQQIKEFAEKYGYDESFVEDLLKIAGPKKADVSEDIKKKLDEIEAEKRANFQESEFKKEYEKDVLPLLKAEGIAEDKYDEILKMVKDLAFTQKYAGTPLKVIFKGVDDFDEFKTVKGKKSAEHSKGGARGEEQEVNIMELEGEEFEKASDELGKKQKIRTYSAPQ